MANTFKNSNDQQNQNMDPDMRLAFKKESNRHEERKAEIDANTAIENRRTDLDARRVALQEEESKARLKADEAESETANSIRTAGFTALVETLKWVREEVFPTMMKEKTMRSMYNQAMSAARSGICTRIDWNSGTVEVYPTPKVGVGCFFNDPHDVEVKEQSNKPTANE